MRKVFKEEKQECFIGSNPYKMKEFMVHAKFPDELTKEFFSLIPSQRKMINELFKKRVLTSYSMAFDEAKLWLTVSADSLKEVYKCLSSLPLLKFMKVRIYELTYNENIGSNEPKLSLN